MKNIDTKAALSKCDEKTSYCLYFFEAEGKLLR